jgi:hypothetical protein
MSTLKRIWTQIVRFAEALEGMDDPIGDAMLSIEKRADKLERDVRHLERQHQQSHSSGDE